jgi:hypothetical protein
MLRHPELEDNYDRAWTEWATTGQDEWDATVVDGLGDAAR